MGVNATRLRPKLMTFKKVVSELSPSVFFLEETKFKEVGKLKMSNYVIFEKVRGERDGGGLAIGCIPELTLSVKIFVKKFKIRCCVAYGCQETDSIENKEAFWKYMNEEVLDATQSDPGLVMQFDGNLWTC